MISLNGSAGSRKKSHTKTVVTVFLIVLVVLGVKYAPSSAADVPGPRGAAVVDYVLGV